MTLGIRIYDDDDHFFKENEKFPGFFHKYKKVCAFLVYMYICSIVYIHTYNLYYIELTIRIPGLV